MKHPVLKQIHDYSSADGIVPGVRGQRAFPSETLKYPNPFLLLDHIGPQQLDPNYRLDGAFHPHRGFETITFMFDGYLNHKDTLGNESPLHSGHAQLMNAGSGLQHGGTMGPDETSKKFNEIQLWINSPQKHKLSKPFIESAAFKDMPVSGNAEAALTLVAGVYREQHGPLQTKADTLIMFGKISKDSSLNISSIPEKYNSMIYMLNGSLELGGERLNAFQTGIIETYGDLSLKSNDGAHFLFLAGKPISEPMVMGGPFVMNTKDEIEQAYEDFRQGKI